MKKLRSLLALLLSVLIITPSLSYAYESPVFIRGVRPLAMGGAFVALADDRNAFFYNPAGITQRTGSEFTLFEMPVSISNDSMKFYQYFTDNKDKLEKFDKLTPTEQADVISDINNTISKYKTRVMLGFPNVSYLTPGGDRMLCWGFGVFDQVDLGLQFRSGILIPNLSYWGKADVIGAVPLAHRFNELPYNVPGKLSVGVNLKYIMRGNINETKSVLELENIDPQLQMGRGYGMDLGTLYQPNSRWNFGLQITDLGGTTIKYDALDSTDAGKASLPAYNNMINSEWNVGTAFIPSKIYYWPGKYINTRDRLLLLADVRDLLSSEERVISDYFWKKLHLGAEFRVGPLSVRGGFNSGYPTFGLGARIPLIGLRADYAYWTDEAGAYAGQIADTNHRFSIALSWGDSKGRAYGKDAKVEETPKAEKTVPVKEEPKKEVKQKLDSLEQGTTVPMAAPVVSEPAKAAAESVAVDTAVKTEAVKQEAAKTSEQVKEAPKTTEQTKEAAKAEAKKTEEKAREVTKEKVSTKANKATLSSKKSLKKKKLVAQK